MLLKNGEHEQAVVEGGKLIKLDRKSIKALGLRAEAFYMLGDLTMAVSVLLSDGPSKPTSAECCVAVC